MRAGVWSFLRRALALGIAFPLAACGDPGEPAPEPDPDGPVDLMASVDPIIGTGGLGFGVGSTYPGPALPFAMIHAGPDTRAAFGAPGFSHCAGYYYDDEYISAFSLVRMNGTGVPDYGIVGLMPVDGISEARREETGFMTGFDHADEEASPGYYRVVLENGIEVEITTATRAAIFRIRYPEGVDPVLLFDLEHNLGDGESGPSTFAASDAGARVDVTVHNAGALSRRFGGFELFAAFAVEPAPAAHGAWDDAAGYRPGETDAVGEGVGGWLAFPDGTREVVVRVGVSFVDGDGARANLAAEIPDFDFDAVRAAAEDVWREELGRVYVEDARARDATLLATALYRTLLMPTLMTDVDGRMRDAAGEIVTADGPRYSDFSLWDTYRTTHPWLVLAEDPRNADFAASLIGLADVGGALPRWSLAHGDIRSMVGSPADMVLAGMAQKGVAFDEQTGWEHARVTAFGPQPREMGGRNAITEYMEHGYVPAEAHSGSVAKTLEYAIADYALAQWARRLGESADADTLEARAMAAWRHHFEPSSGFLVPKLADGSWDPSWDDPLDEHDAYTEGTAWQYLWMVPHDPDGLAEALGGRDAALAKLRAMFEASMDEQAPLGLRLYYWQGNEPDIIAPWLFSAWGSAAEAVDWIDWIVRDHYGLGADGLPGNDDGGTMSAWLVFAHAGLYPIAGTDRYLVAAPRQRILEIRRPSGTLRIEAEPDPRTHPRPVAVTIDGAPVEDWTLTHDQLVGDRTLRFEMQ